MRRLIFVTTWYGPDTIGGAETLCRWLAEELHQARYPAKVFTTTGRGYTFPWFEPHYAEGAQEWNQVPVHRFPPCRWEETTFLEERFDLVESLPPFPAEEMAHLMEMPQSDALYRALAQDKDALFVFFVYSHNLSFWGTRIAPERSFLFPCLHDEPYAHHSASAFLMQQVRAVFCISEPERELATRLYHLPPERTPLVGAGADIHWQGQAERFRARWGIGAPFLLYVGRRDPYKHAPTLIQFFCAYKERRARDLKLLLAGPGPVYIPPAFAGSVVDLGVLSEQEKHDAYAAATLFCQPSPLESFSIVLAEAWLQGTPALVNADCAVTTFHCQHSNGGLYYRDYLEFEACLDYLLERPAVRQRMGAAGRAYVLEHHTWPAVIRRFVQAVEGLGFPLEPLSPGTEG